MAKRTLFTFGSLFMLAVCSTASPGEELLLYAPKPAAGEQAPASPKEGVLVKTVTVKRGDTLGKLSRKHIGVADYFPQMLVFNTIKNPDLIHPGDRLLVPVPAGKATSVEKGGHAKKRHASRRHPSSAKTAVAISPAEKQPVKQGERESFQRAQHAYQERDYQEALALFSGFLKKFPHSTFAADASLYRANCFLHLSGE